MINQIYIAEHLRNYFNDIVKKTYNLQNYSDINKPSFFYGIFSKNDLKVLRNHQAEKIIIWTGGDINYSSSIMVKKNVLVLL